MTQARLLSCAALVVGAGFLSGCPMPKYSGDGTLVDNGPSSATDRYILDLGPIDLTRRGQKTFRLAGLPESNFVVGIQISAATDPTVISNRSLSPTVSLSLSEASGKVVFSKRASLHSWTWSVPANGDAAFVYSREHPSTYFDAAPNAKYTLTFDVVEPDQVGSKYVARLAAKTGGWK